MLTFQLGIDLVGWPMTLRTALTTAAELGAQAVVLDARGEIRLDQFGRTAVRQLRKTLDDLNLRVAAVSFRSRRGYATTAELDRRVEATKEAMELAYHLGTSLVLGAIGPLPPPDSDARHLLLEVLADLGQHGQRAGAMLAAETADEEGASLAGLLEQLPQGTLGVDFNPGKLVLSRHNPRAAIQALGPWIVHVHATDAVNDLGPGSGRPTPLGQGAVDFPTLLGELEEFAYRGYFTVQAWASQNPVHESAMAIQYFRSL